jgi:DNA invertase Pin-like site-specific DNA recombinase
VTKLCGFAGSFCKEVQLGQKAALYCRVSTADQSCERQERDLFRFAARVGYEVLGVWKETASGTKDDRTERKKVMAALAEFERDLLRERIRSGVAAARARGVVFGRQPGQRVKADKLAPKVLALVATGQSYRQIGRQLDISKNTVLDIVKRARLNQSPRL